jgi:hypothetical protein
MNGQTNFDLTSTALQQWLETVKRMAVWTMCNSRNATSEQIAVPAEQIFTWMEMHKYISTMAT